MNPLMTGSSTNRGAQIVAALLAAILLLPTVAYARTDFFTVCGKQVSLNQDRFRCDNPRNIDRLATLTRLRELQLHLSVRGSERLQHGLDLAFLAKLKHLKRLDVTTSLAIDLRQIAAVPGLQWLTIASDSVHDLRPLGGRTQLKVLRLYLQFVRREPDLTPLGKLRQLRCRVLWMAMIPESMPMQTAPLAQLRELETLVIWGARGVADIGPLSRLHKLRSLSLNRMGLKSLAALAGLTRLEELSLDQTPVANLSPLRALGKLASLDLRRTRVSDIRPLAALPRLHTLSLAGAVVNDLNPIAQLKQLTSLRLDRRQLAGNRKLLSRLQKQRPRLRVLHSL